jgi:hypothetical protein
LEAGKENYSDIPSEAREKRKVFSRLAAAG